MHRKVGTTKRRKRATTKKVTHRRRRRIGGITTGLQGSLIEAGGVVAGAFAAVELDNLITKNFSTISQNMSGAIQIAVGVFLPKFIKKGFVKDIGLGMIANGGLTLLQQNGLINGANDRMVYRINGTNSSFIPGGNPQRLAFVAGNGNPNNLRFISGGGGNNYNDPPTGRPGATVGGTGAPARVSRPNLKNAY